MHRKIIDVHAHTTNKLLWDLHVKTATIADLENWARKYGVMKIILMATYFPFKKSGLYNRELLKRIAGNNLFAMCASLDAASNLNQGLEEIEELARAGAICGIKLYPGYQEFQPSEKRIFPIYELAAAYNLPIIFHAGDLHDCCREETLKSGKLPCGFTTYRLETLKD
jgi:predicted TIM-barrel fold metal-dependent hydrolase